MDDLLRALLSNNASNNPDEGDKETGAPDLLKTFLENSGRQIPSQLDGLLGVLQPSAEQPSPDASRTATADLGGLNIAGLLEKAGMRDILVKFLAEKFALPVDTVEAVVGTFLKEKKRTRKKTSATSTAKRKSATSRRTASSTTAKKKSTASSKKTATKRSTTRKSPSSTTKPKTKKSTSKKSSSSTSTRKRSSTKKP
jgi:hypothetical protein